MAQIKVYGLSSNLSINRKKISEAIHQSVMASLQYPAEKKFHRFIPLSNEDFIFPPDRSTNYIIIEISMFEGRSTDVKKKLLHEIFNNIKAHVGIEHQDIEITIFETPKENWGIRGQSGDELNLAYKVDI